MLKKVVKMDDEYSGLRQSDSMTSNPANTEKKDILNTNIFSMECSPSNTSSELS